MKTRDYKENMSFRYSSVKYIHISSDQSGRRIDNYLCSILYGIPRSRIYQMIRRGEVRIDGRRVKPGYQIQEGEKLRIPPVSIQNRPTPDKPKEFLLNMIEKHIIHDDANLVVVNKPSGIVVHSGTGRSFGVIEILRTILQDKEDNLQLAHRLDKETSGILLVAKNMQYLKFLHQCFKNRLVKKTYKSLLVGKVAKRTTIINKSISRNRVRDGERLSNVDKTGKSAETIFRKIRFIQDSTLTDIEIKTGRTHQIRVHAAYMGHPVAGDEKYGIKSHNKTLKKLGLNRPFLHAEAVKIPAYKNIRSLTFKASLPDNLEHFISIFDGNK